MHRKIGEISEIKTGYTLRKALEHQINGDIFIIQAKDIKIDNELLKVSDLSKISSKDIRNPYFLKYNDILLISRSFSSGSFRSSLFTSNKDNVIASSSLYIIRVNNINILPKYLSLYLNSMEGQKQLSTTIAGSSSMQNIIIKNLINLEIPIPNINKQKSIIDLSENIKKQEKILNRKNQLKKDIINSIFTNINK